MASYHAHVSEVQRSKGHNAVASSAYISRSISDRSCHHSFLNTRYTQGSSNCDVKRTVAGSITNTSFWSQTNFEMTFETIWNFSWVERLKWPYLLPFFFEYKYIHGPSTCDVKRTAAGTVTNTLFDLGLTKEWPFLCFLCFLWVKRLKWPYLPPFFFEYKVYPWFLYLWCEKNGGR